MQGALFVLAQQDLGIRSSRYAGIQAALMNPSAMTGQEMKWDVNVASTGVLFDNNFLYIPKGAVPVLGFRAIIKGVKNEDKFVTRFNSSDPGKRYNFILSNEIMGPSFQATIGKDQVVGFTLLSRTYANINNFTGNVAQNAYDYMRNQRQWNQSFHDNTTRINGMSWLEYGFYYAATIHRDDKGELAAGVGLKYLQGIGAAYVKNTNLTYTIGDTTQLIFTQSNLDYGRTDYDSYKRPGGYHGLNHGHGFGASFGATYTRFNGRGNSNYFYKLGISLIDVGAIKFDRMTSAFHLQADSANFMNWYTYNLATNEQVDRTLSAAFYQGDSSKSYVGSSFKMGLPAAIGCQADWNCYGNFFVNATIMKSFGHGSRQGVVRPDVYSITPRYETKCWEASLPFSVIYYGNWRPRLGFAFRIWYLFFGGDAPASLLGLHNMNGVDFYAGIHFFRTR
jgi:hypothetical protein